MRTTRNQPLDVLLLCVGFLVLAAALFGVSRLNPEVTFADPNLELAVREAIGQPEGAIYHTDLRRKAKLSCADQGITDLGGMEHFTGLDQLDLSGNPIGDLTPLSGLRRLTDLSLRGCGLSDLSALEGLSGLRRLDLRDNDIESIAFLSRFYGLERLNLRGNSRLADLTPLAGLTQLRRLNLSFVPVGAQVSLLANMTALQELELRDCGITEYETLAALMRQGALADDAASSVYARIDLRENPVLDDPQAPGLDEVKQFWDRATYRFPTSLRHIPVETIEKPAFSHSGGFYQQAVELRLTCGTPGAVIRYTLDGSEPTAQSPLYEAPIHISEAGPFCDPVEMTQGNAILEVEASAFSQGSVVRASAFLPDGGQSNIETHTLFIGESSPSSTFATLSLVTDSSYLFDSTIGIYAESNTGQSGSQWERPLHLEFYEPDGTLGFAQDLAVRLHGGGSRQNPQKSLRLIVCSYAGAEDRIAYPVFLDLVKKTDGTPLAEFQSLVLRNSGNDSLGNENNGTQIRDVFMQSLVADDPDVATQASRPAHVFINGYYWGIYNIRERMDENYLAGHYGLPAGDITLLQDIGGVTRGQESEGEAYQALRDYAQTRDLSDPAHYQVVAEQLDLENYVAYYSANVYFDNKDWPQNNVKFWRATGQPWRWMLYDTDYGFHLTADADYPGEYAKKFDASLSAERNGIKRLLTETSDWLDATWPNALYRALMENDAFRQKMLNRFANDLNTRFTESHVVARLNELEQLYLPEIDAHMRRWAAGYTVQVWESLVQVLRDYAQERPAYMWGHIVETFALEGTARLTLRTDPSQGCIRVNGLDIQDGTPGVSDPQNWTGSYFIGVPVALEAIPLPGYEFVRWEESGEQGATLQVSLTGDATYTAVFQKIKPQ